MSGLPGRAGSGRSERQIFDELAALCVAPGYAHAIAYLCFRDNIVRFVGEMKAEDMAHMSSMKNLSRTEISTLIGLMVKAPIDYAMPAPQAMQDYITRTDALLAELHQVMSLESFQIQDWKRLASEGGSPFQQGQAYREPIFYGGESAYVFQYLDLAGRKYAADDSWLQQTKGFTIGAAQSVVRAVGAIQSGKLPARLEAMRQLPPADWTILPAHLLTTAEVAKRSGIDAVLVERVLEAFTLPDGEANQAFTALDDFSVANALPLLRFGKSEYLLYQSYRLAEALYEAPFYWMSADKTYRAAAMSNRGRFAEAFAAERLRRVFGGARVHTNVDIYESKGQKSGEVDVLVVFANRAIVLQAKSKRLTLEARKGNDQVIKDDFKKSVQEAYDQGHLSASMLTDRKFRFVDATGAELAFDRGFREVYILCTVSDHYPALSFQARHFLKHQETEVIKPPFVLDVFTLDAMTEMLESPLRFLSYLHRRTLYADRLHASELTILSYHLKKNLWLDDEYSMVVLGEDLSADLDIAMTARRDGIPGRTPDDARRDPHAFRRHDLVGPDRRHRGSRGRRHHRSRLHAVDAQRGNGQGHQPRSRPSCREDTARREGPRHHDLPRRLRLHGSLQRPAASDGSRSAPTALRGPEVHRGGRKLVRRVPRLEGRTHALRCQLGLPMAAGHEPRPSHKAAPETCSQRQGGHASNSRQAAGRPQRTVPLREWPEAQEVLPQIGEFRESAAAESRRPDRPG